MSVDPAPLSERQETVSRSEMEMDDVDSLGNQADVSDDVQALLND
jgi:hypothetical protein